MGNKTLIYKQRLLKVLKECDMHLERLKNSISKLNLKYLFPLDRRSCLEILASSEYLAYNEQVIYRFSKFQDTIGAKLFKSFLLYQGESVDIPFLDILNKFEKIDVINVDKWFELRELRNKISHNYDNNDEVFINILNFIYGNISYLKNILEKIKGSVRA